MKIEILDPIIREMRFRVPQKLRPGEVLSVEIRYDADTGRAVEEVAPGILRVDFDEHGKAVLDTSELVARTRVYENLVIVTPDAQLHVGKDFTIRHARYCSIDKKQRFDFEVCKLGQ